jgi:streptogramin lyase
MMEPSLTTLIDIGDDIQGRDQKWSAFVDGGDGFFYGIPYSARRVVKFDPLDRSLKEIGPDLGEGEEKWLCGVLANTGSIYCAPCDAEQVLKIDTIQGTVEILDNVRLPETGDYLWMSGALAPDNYIYYMPFNARRIMRLNPDNDSLYSVGDDLGEGWGKYSGTVVGNDDCVYGIPHGAKRIIKFDPTNPHTTSTVGEEAEEGFNCGNGVLGGDGYIYAANRYGQVLKVDATHNNYIWIGDPIYDSEYGSGWGAAIVGADECIYWPPSRANRVLRFDPETQQLPSLVGDEFGGGGRQGKWLNGALATTDGVIYCLPFASTQILAIDPFKELAMTMKNNIIKYPEELGRLFVKDEECNETFYNSAVRKFGIEKVFKCLPSDGKWADSFRGSYFPLFMVAASCENCDASVIYHLLRRNVHDALSGNDVGVSKKRKLNK